MEQGHESRLGQCPNRLCRGATPTGLEPAASAVTGRRANQLRYGAWRALMRVQSGWNSNPSSQAHPNRHIVRMRPFRLVGSDTPLR